MTEKNTGSKFGEMVGKVDSLENAVQNISDHGCAKLVEREREFGELIGEVKALRKDIIGNSARMLQIEKSLNQIIGNRQAQEIHLGYLQSFISAVISIVIGLYFRGRGNN